MNRDCLAFDRATVRTIDADGKLHVKISHISKATVNPYYGYEIPNFESLGLVSDKIYMLLRDPKELEKGAASFNNLQIFSKHIPAFVGINESEWKPFLIGSTGTEAQFNAPYLDNSIVIYDAIAIAGIETKRQREISCSYRYTPVMVAGEYEGVPYDGVMTEIIGNHVALVESGRAGSDVVVGDSNPFLEIDMSQKSAKIASAVLDGIKGNLAQDSKLALADIQKLVKTAMDAEKMDDEDKPVAEDEDAQKDGESDEDYKIRMEKKPAMDNDKGDDDKVSKTAMDAAIASAAKDAEARTVARMTAIRKAEDEVRPVIGSVVAQDSADAVYKLALDHLKVDLTGLDKTTFGSVFRAVSANQAVKKPNLAQDSGIDSATSLSNFLAKK